MKSTIISIQILVSLFIFGCDNTERGADRSSDLLPVGVTDSNGVTLWGYIDGNGNEVFPPQFYSVTSFTNGIAMVRDRKRGNIVINYQGKELIPSLSEFANNYRAAQLALPLLKTAKYS
ncbi:MAG: WG repeat-containing protein [bacterium]|nr:WG repeat-containing protein [bacterium]